jgi:hypothetical protein
MNINKAIIEMDKFVKNTESHTIIIKEHWKDKMFIDYDWLICINRFWEKWRTDNKKLAEIFWEKWYFK